MKMSEAAYRLGINVSTAKSIIYKYRETGQITKTVNFGDTLKQASTVRKLALASKATSQTDKQEVRPLVQDTRRNSEVVKCSRKDYLPETLLTLMEHINSKDDKPLSELTSKLRLQSDEKTTATPTSASHQSNAKPPSDLLEKLLQVVQQLSENKNSDTLAINELAELKRQSPESESKCLSVTRAFANSENIQNPTRSNTNDLVDLARPVLEENALKVNESMDIQAQAQDAQ